MRFPKLPAHKDEPTHVEHGDTSPAGTGSPTASISGYGETGAPKLPPPPLTSDLTKSIRFTVSEPEGYYFDQVENFVQQVVEALAYYEHADYLWRQAQYEMQVESDQQAYDLQRLRSEIELFKVQGSPLVNPDGTYITESQQAQVESLMADLSEAHFAVAQLQDTVRTQDAEVARLQDIAASQDQEIVALRQWGDQMIADMQALQAQVAVAHTTPNTALAPDLADADSPTDSPTDSPVNSPDDSPEESPRILHDDSHTDIAVVTEVSPAAPANPLDLVSLPTIMLPGTPLEALPSDAADMAVEDEEDDYDEFDDSYDDSVDGEDEFEDDSDGPSLTTADAPTVEEPNAEDRRDLVADGPVVDLTQTLSEVSDTDTSVGWGSEDAVAAESPNLSADADPETVVAASNEPDTNADGQPDAEADQEVDTEAGPEVDTEADAEQPDEDEFGDSSFDDDYGTTVPVVPVNSELPEGAELPGTGEAAITYPPAAPGLPLDTQGVAVEVWAPELDPRLRGEHVEDLGSEPGPVLEAGLDAEHDAEPDLGQGTDEPVPSDESA